MVEVKINTKTGKCEIIDDSEGTIGSSRQITRFRQYCFPILIEEVKKDKTLKSTNANNIRFNEFGFEFSPKAKGIIGNYIYEAWESIDDE